MACAIEPTPAGWQVWRGPVPPALVQIAVDARDHIHDFAYGSFAAQVSYQGQTVGVYKSHHTWTNRGGQIVTGICIPGISLLVPAGSAKGSPGVAGLPPAPGMGDAPPNVDALLTPDPSAALFGADDLDAVDWSLVTKTGLAAGAVVLLFWLALQHAGALRPRR